MKLNTVAVASLVAAVISSFSTIALARVLRTPTVSLSISILDYGIQDCVADCEKVQQQCLEDGEKEDDCEEAFRYCMVDRGEAI
ncbi:MAG: hypothetical protein M1816_003297 [Peltula sp. TS41687]|nr:MAG: hypothetical protein M1816_003297 [Peltula sp. TS41687]